MDTSFNAMVSDVKKAGVKTRTLDCKEVDDWTTATKYADVQTAFARGQESKGVANAVEVLKEVDAILATATK